MIKIVMPILTCIVLGLVIRIVHLIHARLRRLQPETKKVLETIFFIVLGFLYLVSLTKESPRDAKVSEYYRRKINASYQPPLANTVAKDRFNTPRIRFNTPGSIFNTPRSIFDKTGSIFDEF